MILSNSQNPSIFTNSMILHPLLEKGNGIKRIKLQKIFILNYINLGNGSFKDYDVDFLLDLAENREKYNGKSKTY